MSCVTDPALEVNYPSRWPAWAKVSTRNGRQLRAEIEFPKGDPENALSWDELKDKFRNLTRPILSSGQQDDIIGTVDSLEALDDIRTLSRLTQV